MTARRIAVAVFYGLLIVGSIAVGHLLPGAVGFQVRPINEPEVHRVLMGLTGLYVIASALPFVPGAEIGLALIAALGAPIVPLVYVAMLAALALAYFVGRSIPPALLARAFGFLGMKRAEELARRAAALAPDERRRMLLAQAEHRLPVALLRGRYVALAVLFNLPGNTLIGGGGGIAMLAGMSGLFSPLAFLATIALAVAPVPLLVLLTGYRL